MRVDHRADGQRVALVLVHGFSGDTEGTWTGVVRHLLDEPSLRTWHMFGLGYRHAINNAFLVPLASIPDAGVSEIACLMAKCAIGHSSRARPTHWTLATQDGASLLLKDLGAAEMSYARANEAIRVLRQIDSMSLQAIRVTSSIFGEADAYRVER